MLETNECVNAEPGGGSGDSPNRELAISPGVSATVAEQVPAAPTESTPVTGASGVDSQAGSPVEGDGIHREAHLGSSSTIGLFDVAPAVKPKWGPCKKCGYVWESKTVDAPRPKWCPNCRRVNWDVAPRKYERKAKKKRSYKRKASEPKPEPSLTSATAIPGAVRLPPPPGSL